MRVPRHGEGMPVPGIENVQIVSGDRERHLDPAAAAIFSCDTDTRQPAGDIERQCVWSPSHWQEITLHLTHRCRVSTHAAGRRA